jgi:hypothetical protein
MASSTCEGCTLPEEQAEPEETAIPARSNPITAVSALRPGTVNSVVFGNRGRAFGEHDHARGMPQALFEPISQAFETDRVIASRLSMAALARRRRTPQFPRHSRSPPGGPAPDRRRAAAARTRAPPRPGPAAPTPLGPPILCADSVTRSAFISLISNGIFPNAWIASTCSKPPAAWTIAAGLRHRLHRAGLVVGQHHRHQRRRPAREHRAQRSRSTRPERVTPTVSMASGGNRPPASTEACSIAETTSLSTGASQNLVEAPMSAPARWLRFHLT